MDENIANQNHATRTRTPKPGYLRLCLHCTDHFASDAKTIPDRVSVYI